MKICDKIVTELRFSYNIQENCANQLQGVFINFGKLKKNTNGSDSRRFL